MRRDSLLTLPLIFCRFNFKEVYEFRVSTRIMSFILKRKFKVQTRSYLGLLYSKIKKSLITHVIGIEIQERWRSLTRLGLQITQAHCRFIHPYLWFNDDGSSREHPLVSTKSLPITILSIKILEVKFNNVQIISNLLIKSCCYMWDLEIPK